MDRVDGATWRKSSYSGANGGDCVEVVATDAVLVRDTQDRQGPTLRFAPETWRMFADRVKRSLTPDPLPRGVLTAVRALSATSVPPPCPGTRR